MIDKATKTDRRSKIEDLFIYFFFSIVEAANEKGISTYLLRMIQVYLSERM